MASKTTLRLLTGAALPAALLIGSAACAQDFPSRPIRFLVPFTPGGIADIVARMISLRMGEQIGQNVVIDNRAGAGGAVAAELTAKARPDGHTILLCSASVVVFNPLLTPHIPYQPLRDFAMVSLVTSSPYLLLVHPSSPAQSVKELIALARAKPGALNYGSPGVGTTTHLVTELFRHMAGVQFTHVPYKGASVAANDLVGGHLNFMFEAFSSSYPNVQAGRLRALGVSTRKRFSMTPQIQAIAEIVPGYEGLTWQGICAPVATPRPILTALNGAIVKAVRSPEVVERLGQLGTEAIGSTPDEFLAYAKEDIARWDKAIRAIGAKP
jgi:tripartite-type tricarboxylate transporter receptor subunit TctC